jgi:two-component system CheB/CheR fusion protein
VGKADRSGVAAATLPAVVGIGASAGGLEALKKFFGAFAADTGLAFVVVVHLDPTHESLMPELLAKSTTLAVTQAQDRQALEPNHVYIIPPNRQLTLEEGRIRLEEPEDRRGLRGNIDQFFRSLAEDQRERAIGIVLSGTGTEGTLGLRAIKAAGGMVMAQRPETAAQPGMPQSAITTGLVDVVLAPEKMPKVLIRYVRHPYVHRPAPTTAPEQRPADGLNSIVALLRARRKYDFRGYKKGTLHRRVERRMGLQQIRAIPKYLDFLHTHPAEIDQLFKDLLIEVTSFFRDAAAFEELATKVLAPLVRAANPDVPVRIWVPGCATGEEAYSIAILVAEQIARAQSPRQVQIFATDVDDEALEVARAGAYPESIGLDVTPPRLQRFFTREDHQYKVAKSIRESVTFAVQNLISDPPFSKLDLVSCRNVLIYLEPEVQRKLIALFHFALNPGGHLFLGTAESPGQADELFTPVSKRWRIYERVGTTMRPQVDIPSFAAGEAVTSKHAAAKELREPAVTVLGERQLLQHFAPAAVVVNRAGQILHLWGAMKRYLEVSAGAPTLDVATMTRDPLRPTVRAALHDAIRRNRAVSLEALPLKKGRRQATVRITVTPVKGARAAEGTWLLIFEELPSTPIVSGRRVAGAAREIARRLEAELKAAKKDQQSLVEQLERSNEDLRAANEEVTSMNEELQSTNEELQSSKEELQSMNEELSTVNAQLHEKVEELTTLSDDLANLLSATDIATVFVDAAFHVSRFTPAATRLLNLIASDVGRPIGHLATNLVDLDLQREAEAVLRDGRPVEKAVDGRDGRHYIVRILPYEREDRRAQGVVVTFVDVTTLKTSERELHASRRYAEEIAGLNHRALGGLPLGDLMTNCVNVVADVLRLPTVEVLEHDASGGTFASRASVGMEATTAEPTGPIAAAGSPEGAALVSGQTTMLAGIQSDGRFAHDPRVRARRQESGIFAIVSLEGKPWGVLAASATTGRAFLPDEVKFVEAVANTLGTALTRARKEAALRLLTEALEQRVAERTRHLALVHDVTHAINEASTWDEGLRLALREVCRVEGWQLGYVYMPRKDAAEELVPVTGCFADERFLPFHEASQAGRYARDQSLPGRVFAERRFMWVNGQDQLAKQIPFRAEAARQVGLQAGLAMPVTIGQETIAVLELFSDQPHQPNEELTRLMTDIGAQISRAIDRERLMGEVADLMWRDQQNLLRTLHDSLGQRLTGLGMLSSGLAQQLKDQDAPAVATARQIAEQAKQSLEQVRELSRGLFPVEVDAAGLMVALKQLASTTESVSKIQCRVEENGPVLAGDNRSAAELYHIAQESVTNALKHAEAHAIAMRLSADAGTITLSIADDGVGIRNRLANSSGMGLRIMRYRAMSIGANLSIEPGPTGGTVVTCTLREGPRPRTSALAGAR